LIDAAGDLIYGEYLLRAQLGESPGLDEFACRFPGVADRLRVLVEMERSLEPTTDPDPSSMTWVHGPGANPDESRDRLAAAHPGALADRLDLAGLGRTRAGIQDGTTDLFRTRDWRPTAHLSRHGGEVTGAAFSPDGRTLFTSSRDRTLGIRDVASG